MNNNYDKAEKIILTDEMLNEVSGGKESLTLESLGHLSVKYTAVRVAYDVIKKVLNGEELTFAEMTLYNRVKSLLEDEANWPQARLKGSSGSSELTGFSGTW